MPQRFKVDEDLPREVADRFRKTGHDACTVAEQGMAGTPDSDLWKAVLGEGRWLVTADKGFASPRTYPISPEMTVVLLRLPRESRTRYIQLTDFLLANIDMESVKGSIVVVTPDAIRIHRPA